MKRIVIIGGGPAGYPAALKAASLGAQVTLIEKNRLGGVCLNCGCIPSKSFLEGAHRFQTAFSAAALGNEGAAQAAQQLFEMRDFNKLKVRQQAATQKLVQGISFLLKKAHVEVINGEASFVDAHTLSVRTQAGEKQISFDGAIIATGSEAFYPAPLDTLRGQIYDNSNFFTMEQLPQSMAIVGGGVIGCEMADFLNAFGVEVHLIEMQPRLLPLEDETVSRTLAQAFIKRGINLYTGVSAAEVHKTADRFEIVLSDGKKLQTQAVLAAIGRSIDLSALHLERIGVAWTRKGVQVNPKTMQLTENIYAAGDVTGLLQLAHAATRQGEVAASNLCGVPAEYDNTRVPRAVYTTPEIASVGLSAVQAQTQGIELKKHKSFFLANGRAVAQDQTDGYVEWLSDAGTGKLLGACSVGTHASELIHIAAIALEAQMTVEQFRRIIFAHPTFAETWTEALSR
ncbi:MAG: dihydrolipoyl dehydrogenase [Elusimicrobiaceae bacterium]|nr:dihydrolipoyl dehydrogenase [Elusimicrobiaceae bacterium]